jgi:hypothetical protein
VYHGIVSVVFSSASSVDLSDESQLIHDGGRVCDQVGLVHDVLEFGGYGAFGFYHKGNDIVKKFYGGKFSGLSVLFHF